MKTNLLVVDKLPSVVYSCATKLTYPEANEILKSKSIFYHLYKNKLYFFGDPELLKESIKNDSSEIVIENISLNQEFIEENWNLLRVLLYKAARDFLFNKGFSCHWRNSNRFFIVNKAKYNWIALIYDFSSPENSAFVHEGFNIFFKRYDKSIYFGMNPCVVVTSNGKDIINPKDLRSDSYLKYKRDFIDRRYSAKIREMLDTFVKLLSEKNNEIIIPLFKENIKIENKFVEID